MIRAGLIIGILLSMFPVIAGQDAIYKIWVQLKDKNHNIYSIENPGEFLSQKALDRRERQSIPIIQEDLPVSTAYLDSLMDFPLRILYTSKWMNSAIIQTEDSGLFQTLPELDFITDVDYLSHSPLQKKSGLNKWDEKSDQLILPSDHQVSMLNGQDLHDSGYRGQGMIIAVLDGGFTNTNTISGFDSLFLNGRILGTRNLVEPDSNFFWDVNGSHGTSVLSIMGGEIQGQYEGSASKASFLLIQTEDSRSEFKIEEANWLAAAELADSVGADIINTSLGYSVGFTDPEQNYSYSDLDGKSALVTRAAQIAATKGILVVSSAGNSGRPGDEWGYITPPADAEDILAVGAVNAYGVRADFSGRGPSYDGRIKPDVVALGVSTSLIRSSGLVESGNGTSFASPVVAGLAACLWQKNRALSNYDILDAIRMSASLNPYPDTLLGYGLPNFGMADDIITAYHPPESRNNELLVYPNPASEMIFIPLESDLPGNLKYRIHDITGKICLEGHIVITSGNELILPVKSLPPGHFIILVTSNREIKRGRFIKLR